MSQSERVLVIKPVKGWQPLNLGEVWRYRDLLMLLVWRDISANYRQSLVGIGWAVIKPLISVAIFTLIFGRMAKLPSDGVPYAAFNYAALMPWMYFAGCLTESTNSLVGGGHLLRKVYFPRLILPISKLFTGVIDFGVQFVIFLLLLLYFGIVPGIGIVVLPLLLLLCAICALSVGLWLTALNIKYRDIGHLVPFAVQAWMWLTPVVYSTSMVPERWKTLYSLNPMVGVVEAFRWALLGKANPDWTMVGISCVVAVMLLIGGLYYFRRVESTFADII